MKKFVEFQIESLLFLNLACYCINRIAHFMRNSSVNYWKKSFFALSNIVKDLLWDINQLNKFLFHEPGFNFLFSYLNILEVFLILVFNLINYLVYVVFKFILLAIKKVLQRIKFLWLSNFSASITKMNVIQFLIMIIFTFMILLGHLFTFAIRIKPKKFFV